MKRMLSVLLLLAVVLSAVSAVAFAEDAAAYKELAPGSSGNDVRELQRRLTDLGYDTHGVDGSYGNGTKTAILAFQARNGLEETGTATPETQALLYSDDAIEPFVPPVSISSVSWVGNASTLYFQNNTDETIDHVDFFYYAFDASGDLHVASKDHGLGWWKIDFKSIRPGATGSIKLRLDDDVVDKETASVAVGVARYHTTAGNYYEFSEDQMFLRHSDGHITFPADESAPDCMSTEEYEKSWNIVIGYRYFSIPDRIAPLFDLSRGGGWLTEVSEGSLAEKAGLMPDDIIVSFDDDLLTNGHSAEKAKLRMLDGESVTVHYLRDNTEYTTVMSADMDDMSQEAKDAFRRN